MANENFDSVNEYFKHLGQITQEMDRQEMSALWKKAKKGDQTAKRQLMEMNLRLVVPTAKRFQRSGIELMDLIEEGNLGLWQAIEKFEPAKGYRFSTYAIYWIEQYIRKYIEEQSGAIKIPSHAWGNLKRWFRAWNELKETNGRDPSLREMAEELNLSARQVKSIMDTLSAAKGIDSLTSLVREEDDTTLEDLISDDGKGNPHQVFADKEKLNTIQQSLDALDDRDRAIVVMRYGLEDNNPKTLGEVADLLNLSRERVRQLEERAVGKLRMAARAAGILEDTPADYRTHNLHSAMRPTVRKTNILGEVTSSDPFSRMLKLAAKQAKKIPQKATPKTTEKTGKKSKKTEKSVKKIVSEKPISSIKKQGKRSRKK